ncbi:MAG TPA: nucleotidyltransferase domain-containing protein [Thermoanaerobaculia bacterium]|nr:nucleotidyltransferase domain-containing protein [Thermoanaerobaculia bacterium]
MNSDPVIDRIVKIIAEAIRPQKIILFGSRATGTARPDSDLDLVVIYAGEKSKRQVKLDIHRLMEPASLPMDLFVLSPEEMLRQRHVANTLAREVAERGVTVYG